MTAPKLHIGSGSVRHEGWINLDRAPYEGVDEVVDVTKGIPYERASHIFAEHFIEHLAFEDARRFVRECRRILAPEGILRLSTPNLDWVWTNLYNPARWSNEGEAVRDCFWLNKSFRGWGHQFLYNRASLRALLLDCGFAETRDCQYGESSHPELRGLERHEQYDDTPELPHVIIAEAWGSSDAGSGVTDEPIADYLQAIAVS